MSSRLAVVWLLLALSIPSALLASLQHDLTNHQPPASSILSGYAVGDPPKALLGTASQSIVRARCLMRGLFVFYLATGGLDLDTYNLFIQFVAVWVALGLIYVAAADLLPPFAAGMAVLLAVLYVPWGFLSVAYTTSWPYDLPALAFAAMGMWTILARRFGAFALTLALGTLNKETIVFLLPAYLLTAWPHLPRRTWLAQALILLAVFGAAYEIPRITLDPQHLPAVTYSANEVEHPRWVTNLRHLSLRFQGLPLENIYWAFTLHAVPLLGWRALPPTLRAIYLCAPVLLVPVFFVGNIYELRLYNELIPLGAIGTALVLWQRLGQYTLPSGRADSVE